MAKTDLTIKYTCESCRRWFYPSEDQIIADEWDKLCYPCFSFGQSSDNEEDMLFESLIELDHML